MEGFVKHLEALFHLISIAKALGVGLDRRDGHLQQHLRALRYAALESRLSGEHSSEQRVGCRTAGEGLLRSARELRAARRL